MSRFAIVLVGSALLISGCTSGSPTPLASTQVISPSTTPSQVSPSGSPTTSGVRGYSAQAPFCPPEIPAVGAEEPTPVVGEIRAYAICPATPMSAGIMERGEITLTPQDGGSFDALTAALSVPDVTTPAGSAVACRAYADVPILIYVTTTDGTWRVHTPVDGCSHYNADLLDAVDKART
jgi:hypothetical protein